MVCGGAEAERVLDLEFCDYMDDDSLGDCIDSVSSCFDDITNTSACVYPKDLCDYNRISPYQSTNLSTYDIRKICKGPLCNQAIRNVAGYLNQAEVKKAIGASSNITVFQWQYGKN
jgi:hypothetical protein